MLIFITTDFKIQFDFVFIRNLTRLSTDTIKSSLYFFYFFLFISSAISLLLKDPVSKLITNISYSFISYNMGTQLLLAIIDARSIANAYYMELRLRDCVC